jgi:hypothetical protein
VSKIGFACYPAATTAATNELYPLHIFAHGNGAGGAVIHIYTSLMKTIASHGFVVVAYESCPIDSRCHNGETQFIEALKTIAYLENNRKTLPIQFQQPYSASGHSTGARAVLMLAACRDNPLYLKHVQFINVTQSDRNVLTRIHAVVGDHPDPMIDPAQNPDIHAYNITKTPTMLVTGTLDVRPIGEPSLSGWQDFVMMSSLRHRVFLNVRNATHLSPIFTHPEADYIAYFCQYHALRNTTAGSLIYDDKTVHSLAKQSFVSKSVGARNNGGSKKEVGFVACSDVKKGIPVEIAEKYC